MTMHAVARSVPAAELLAGVPIAEDQGDLRARVRALRAERPGKVIILDDDPTGTQSVRGLPVLTAWAADDLRWAFERDESGFFILTNTRGLTSEAARTRLTEIASAIAAASIECDVPYSIVTRSDSTLRGHYPLETDLFEQRAQQSGRPYAAVLIVPAYIAAGRITVGDVHYVEDGGSYLPVGATGYAHDATFGFTASNLRDYVEEKTGGRVSGAAVRSLSLEDIRLGGPERVAEILGGAAEAGDAVPVVVNAVTENDLDVVALGTILAEDRGVRILTRSGPSFVAAMLGIEAGGALDPTEIFPETASDRAGLVVVGSHVELTSRQVAQLTLDHPEVSVVTLDVRSVIEPTTASAEIDRAHAELQKALANGTAMLVTSRVRVDGASAVSSLEIAQLVSSALVTVTRRTVATTTVRWVLAKGGITSSDIATDGLGIRRATVLGQLFPGIVSVWLNESAEGHLTGLPYIVFAGNVGDETTLARAVSILGGGRNLARPNPA